MTIILEDICKSYKDTIALSHFNLKIEWGRCYVLTGPAGCGKTTALKIFMGTEQPDSGQVARMGDYKYPTLHSAYISQNGNLILQKNAIANVKKAHRWASKARAMEELSTFLPKDKMLTPVGSLTPAERGFTEIVRAFFIPADFLVFDEPFANMTTEQKRQSIDYILKNRGSRPLLIATQDTDGLEFAKIIHVCPN